MKEKKILCFLSLYHVPVCICVFNLLLLVQFAKIYYRLWSSYFTTLENWIGQLQIVDYCELKSLPKGDTPGAL